MIGIAALSRYLGHAGANTVFAVVSTLLAIVALIVGSRYRSRQADPDASAIGARRAAIRDSVNPRRIKER
ncbi:hypothetical protein P3T23_005081 [Paraburkholderia sp. GAS448]|uniref:hypothetical protein n=1 Tax=Paraburkholderia sp. GAS448 TaxID=3035136 RepID=UPI003D1C23F2